jgi:hypothetical protein
LPSAQASAAAAPCKIAVLSSGGHHQAEFKLNRWGAKIVSFDFGFVELDG